MINWKKHGKDESKVLSSVNELIRLLQDPFYKIFLNGKYFKEQKINTANNELSIYHGLGRTPKGYIITRTKGVQPVEVSKDQRKIVFQSSIQADKRKNTFTHREILPLPQPNDNPAKNADVESKNDIAYMVFDPTEGESTDPVHLLYRLPEDFVKGTARVHVHWTKTVDTKQVGGEARWRIDWSAFNGTDEDASGGSSPYTGQIFQTGIYLDSGTTTRIVYRLPTTGEGKILNSEIPKNYYITLSISLSNAGPKALAEAGLVAVELTFDRYFSGTLTDEINEFDVMVF